MEKVTSIFVAANPANTNQLRLDEEIRAITQKIRSSEHRDVLELKSIWAARPDDLLQVLNECKPHIVHFSSHGSSTGEIILVDELGRPKAVSTEAIKALFTVLKDNIRVVILNACYSRTQALAITETIDCAIGMRTAIGDRAAITFAASFYRAIGFGCSVQQAFEQGRVALQLEGISEENTPELLVRNGVEPSRVFLGSNSDEGNANTYQSGFSVINEKSALNWGGVVQVLRERLLRKVTEQLSPSVRQYETIRAVEDGCRTLAVRLREESYVPDVIIGWRDPDVGYPGSETVTNLLSRELGIPFRIVQMREVHGKREVAENCHWFKGIDRALIVDDALYSGSTLGEIYKNLHKTDLDANIHFAVLSTLDPHKFQNLHYVSIHDTEELLFPWGWSRLIAGFEDIYKLLGISDQTVWRQNTEWGTVDAFAKKFTGSVQLLTIESDKKIRQEPKQKTDTFLYFLSGSADIHIGNKTGTFEKGNCILIPKSIGYTIEARNTVQILELLSGIE